mgnify:CR=1 FL=1
MTARTTVGSIVSVILLLGLLIACGPEALPSGSALSQREPEPTAQGSALPTASPPEVSVEPASSRMVDSPDTVDIFQIAQEQTAAGEAVMTIQVTLGEGDDQLHIAASQATSVPLPCYPMVPAPLDKRYTCLTGGGFEADLWIARWGEGKQQLLTHQNMGASAWSSDGRWVAFSTLAEQDEQGDMPLKVLDLNTGEERVAAMMSAPYQMSFTATDKLVYLAEGALQVLDLPGTLKGEPLPARSIPLKDIPTNEAYLRTDPSSVASAAWFKVSPKSDKVALLREFNAESGKLSILDLEGGHEVMVAEQMLNLHGAITNIFAWSPDGSTLAFVNLVDGGLIGDAPQMYSELWLVDADGANLRQLWRSEQPYLGYTALRWLPNGKAILTAAAVESFSDLVQVTHAQSGQRADLFQGGKGILLTETSPGVVTVLMQGAFGPSLMYYVSTLVYQ